MKTMGLLVILSVAALAAFAFRHSPLCHDPRDHVVARGDAVFADGGATAYLAVFSRRYRPARAICAFPGEGMPVSIRGALAIYRAEVETGAVTPLLVADLPVRFGNRAGVEFRRRTTGRLLGSYRMRAPWDEAVADLGDVYFEIDTEEGTARVLTQEAYEAVSNGTEEIDPHLFRTRSGLKGPTPGRVRGTEYTMTTSVSGIASDVEMSFALHDRPPLLGGRSRTFAVVDEWPRRGLPVAEWVFGWMGGRRAPSAP